MDSEKITVIGCSRNPNKPSHYVPKYLIDRGFSVYCVNPNAKEIFDKPVFKSIGGLPDDGFGVFDVFRPSEEIPEIVDELIKMNKFPKIFWMQEGIKNKEAKEKLESKGVLVIEDKCIMKAHKEFLG